MQWPPGTLENSSSGEHGRIVAAGKRPPLARLLTLLSSSCICGSRLWTSGLLRKLPKYPGWMASVVGTKMENLLYEGTTTHRGTRREAQQTCA